MEKLYKIREVVEQGLLWIKERKLRQIIQDGEIEVIDISQGSKRKNYRITETAIKTFLERNSIKAN